jgi:hypothetical protein
MSEETIMKKNVSVWEKLKKEHSVYQTLLKKTIVPNLKCSK